MRTIFVYWDEVRDVVSDWRREASRLGIANDGKSVYKVECTRYQRDKYNNFRIQRFIKLNGDYLQGIANH